jgi:hypothetical protein
LVIVPDATNVAAHRFERHDAMIRYLMAGAAALGLLSGAATAQTSTTEQTTTTTAPAPSMAPMTVTNTKTTENKVSSEGVRTLTNGMESTDNSGYTTKTEYSSQTYPLSPIVTTTKKTTTVNDGVATETTTRTDAYPPGTSALPPTTTTTTRTYAVGAR